MIDILPPTSRDPQGTHKAIWDESEEEPFELVPGKQHYLGRMIEYLPGKFAP